jgi:hypothetical protein
MVAFQHPLGLFRLEHSQEWSADYDSETAALLLTRDHEGENSALHFCPLAVSGSQADPRRLLLDHARRLGAWVAPEAVELAESAQHRSASAEGRRPPLGDELPVLYRFRVYCRGTLTVLVTHLGPGADRFLARAAADQVIATLTLPEVIPPTPAEFLTRVLQFIHCEHPHLVATIADEWGVQVEKTTGGREVMIALGALFEEALRYPETADELIRTHVTTALQPLELPEPEL